MHLWLMVEIPVSGVNLGIFCPGKVLGPHERVARFQKAVLEVQWEMAALLVAEELVSLDQALVQLVLHRV